jgi:hypothetical protein
VDAALGAAGAKAAPPRGVWRGGRAAYGGGHFFSINGKWLIEQPDGLFGIG